MKKLLTGILSFLLLASVSLAAQGGGVALTTADGRYVNVTGDTVTGTLTLNNPLNISGLYIAADNIAVSDEASILLPDATAGWGEVFVGDNEERARFSWKADGSVTLMENTANVVNTDTDDKFCIYDNATAVVIKNRLGASKTVKYVINY